MRLRCNFLVFRFLNSISNTHSRPLHVVPINPRYLLQQLDRSIDFASAFTAGPHSPLMMCPTHLNCISIASHFLSLSGCRVMVTRLCCFFSYFTGDLTFIHVDVFVRHCLLALFFVVLLLTTSFSPSSQSSLALLSCTLALRILFHLAPSDPLAFLRALKLLK